MNDEVVRNFQMMEDYNLRFARYNRYRRRFIKTYFSLYHRLKVIGHENIPTGPALIASNHGGGYDLDIMSLSECGHPTRPIQVLIADTWHYLKSNWGRYFIGSGIPLWTKGGIRYEYIDPFLKEGGNQFPGLVAIFPEGGSGTFRERNILHRFFPGVVRIALHYRVPIVPTAMIGYHLASPIVKEFPKDHGPNDAIPFPLTFPVKLKIEFGEPFELSDYYGKELSKEDQWEVANEIVREKVAKLLKKHMKLITLQE